MKKNSDKKYFERYKNYTLLKGIIILILLIGLLSQVLLFYYEKINPKDLSYEYIGWSEYCDGDIYSPESKGIFCEGCINGTSTCNWPLDMNISVGKVQRTLKTNGEIHCFFKIDNINYYTEKGSYYGITENTFFTWQLLDASKDHKLEFCCGIERESIMNTLFHIEKEIEQGCITNYIQPRCSNETI